MPLPSSHESLTSSSHDKVKTEATSKTSSSVHTGRSKVATKRTIKDLLAEGTAKEAEVLERLGAQKHERAIIELELKRRKLEQKALEKKHAREREHEQHEYRMARMQMLLAQNQQGASTSVRSSGQSLYEGLGLMDGLTDSSLPGLPSLPSGPYSI